LGSRHHDDFTRTNAYHLGHRFADPSDCGRTSTVAIRNVYGKVVSFAAFGPYRTFKNGDVETFNGRFHGHKENIQFFFDRTGLCRIGVYMYEGKDVKQGIPAWRRAYELLQKDYGKSRRLTSTS